MRIILLSILLVFTLVYNGLFSPDSSKLNYVLDPEKSVIEWSGASPKVSHQSSFVVTCKELEVANGQIKSGTFVIPITCIKNYDLPKAIKPVLLKYLKSKDFLIWPCIRKLFFKLRT
jgi:hypothetical protein